MDSSTPIWLQPQTLDEALSLRQRYGDEARVVAGGVWIALLLQQGLLQPEAFLALNRVPALRDVAGDGTLRLGGGLSLNMVARHRLVRERIPYLAQTYAMVANERVRNQGTVGGNLCEADYASDPPSMLVALDAQVRLARQGGTRDVPVREFLVGHYETQLQENELLSEVRVPSPPPRTGGFYLKYVSRSSEDRPCAGVAAVVTLDESERCRRLSVVVGAVSSTPVVFPRVTAQAVGERLTPELLRDIAESYASAIEPLSDLRGSAEYRRHLVRVLIPRAVAQALGGSSR